MARTQSAIDKLIEPSLQEVAARRPEFHKSEVVRQVLTHRNLQGVLNDIGKKYPDWGFDAIAFDYIEKKVGLALQKRDANGIRRWECYAAGERERRWLPLRAMTADKLRAVMRETRTQARQLTLKGSGYEFMLEELEKLGPTATIADVYDTAVPKILAHRAA